MKESFDKIWNMPADEFSQLIASGILMYALATSIAALVMYILYRRFKSKHFGKDWEDKFKSLENHNDLFRK